MNARMLRYVVPTILVTAGLGAVAWTWTLAQDVDHLETTGRQSSTRIDRLDALLDEVARGELMYVASGQIEKDSLTSTSRNLQQIVSDTSWLLGQSMAGGTTAAGQVAEAVAALADVDARARENIRADLDLMAADLLFTETSRTRQTLREQLRALRSLESSAVVEARAIDLQQAWMVLAAVAILFAWALVRSPRASSKEPSGNSEPVGLGLETAPMPAPIQQSHAIDLRETAALCTAISCLQGESGLSGLLARTAALLDASGVVIWMTAGEELFPAAGHGYDPKQWAQIGPIKPSGQNATAAAWRSGTLQTVRGNASSRAAIVAPLPGTERCIGVLAIEVTPGREADPETLAITSVIAAQLASVLVAWPAASVNPIAEIVPFERVSAAT